MARRVEGSNPEPSTETTGGNTTDGTSTAATTTGGRTGGRRSGGTGGRTETESVVLEKNLVKTPKPVSVDVPGKEKSEAVDKEEEKKAKQRERQRKYREQKKAQAATTGTKKKSAAKKADASQLNFLLLTISNVMASRPGMEMWKLTNEEVDSIAEPLANMMARNEAVANALEEHGDAIALVTAIAMIAFPRVMMMMAAKKEQAPKHPAVQEVKSNANRSESATGSRDKKGASSGSGQPVTVTPSDSREVYGGTLSSIIPAIGSGY